MLESPPTSRPRAVRQSTPRRKFAVRYLYIGALAFVGGIVLTLCLQLLIPFSALLIFGRGIEVDPDILAVTTGRSKNQVLTALGPPDGTLADALIDTNLRNRYLQNYTPATQHYQAESVGGYNLFWRNQADGTAVKVVAFDANDKVLGTYVLEWATFYKSVNELSVD